VIRVMHGPFHPGAAEQWGIDPLSAAALHAYKRSMMLHRRLLTTVLASEEALHPAQAGCIQVLADVDGASQSELADALHVSRPTVTTMLQRMEAAGIVERQPDAADSRITRVSLTAEGRALAGRMRTAFSEMVDLSVGRLTEADRRELTRILELLNEHVAAALAERGVPVHGNPHEHPHRHEGTAPR
jgi:DNA-binding MarR family transcriptional regulator